MKRTVAIAAALVIVAAGAVGIQRSLSDDGPEGRKVPNNASTADPSRQFDRDLLEKQAEQQAAQRDKAAAELSEQVRKQAEALKQSDPDR